jgi:AAA domain/TrwC relaxase
MNLATRSDGTVGALHSKTLLGWKMAAGAAYHAALACELAQLGFTIDRVGKNGTFEIAGVADAQIRYFSARRAEIESELAQAGVRSGDDGALAASVARRSRQAKGASVHDRHAHWQKIARTHGLDRLPVPDLALERPLAALTGKALFAARLAALPRALTETTSLVDRREVFRAVAEALVGTGLGAEHIGAGVTHLLYNGLVLELGCDALGQSRYTTPEMIAIEREVVAMAGRLLAAPGIALDMTVVNDRCRALGLSLEQATAATAATGSQRVVVIEGAPGTGKTTVLTPIVEAWRAAGYQVLGAATAWRIANNLGDDLGIPARATASWLAQAAMGPPILHDKSVLIVDEAGLLSSREMHAILQCVEQSGARVILVGDRGQLQAIGAGAGLSLVVRASAASRIGTVVRQREAWLRAAIADFGRGKAADALSAFQNHGRLVEADGLQATLRAVVDCVEVDLLQHAGGGTLIVARTNAEVAAISAEVRTRLKHAGIVADAEVVIDTVTPSGHASRIALARGDRIRFLVRNDRLNVVNGTLGIVRHITANGADGSSGARLEVEIDGKIVRFDSKELTDEHGRARLGFAYASTVYGAQGVTVEQAVVLLTPGFDRHHIYVAASRSRGSTTLVVDHRALDGLVREREDGPDPASEVTRAERHAALAARLAVTNVKETTLDAADLALDGERQKAAHRPVPLGIQIKQTERGSAHEL